MELAKSGVELSPPSGPGMDPWLEAQGEEMTDDLLESGEREGCSS